MSWRELTEDDVLGVLNVAETEAYQFSVIGDDQNPREDAIRGVVQQCRGYIGDFASNQLAEGLTLPERVILPALHLVRVELMNRLDITVSEDRRMAARAAMRFFERVSEGKVAIERPEGATEETGSSPIMQSASTRPTIASRHQLRGL